MKKLLEILMKITGSESVRNMSELFVSLTFMVNYGGHYRLDSKGTRTGEREVSVAGFSLRSKPATENPGRMPQLRLIRF